MRHTTTTDPLSAQVEPNAMQHSSPAMSAETFERLWSDAAGSVRRTVRAYAFHTEREDVYAETLRLCWEHRDQFEGGRSFKSWACKIAHNACRDSSRYRMKLCRQASVTVSLNNSVPNVGCSYEEAIPARFDVQRTVEALDYVRLVDELVEGKQMASALVMSVLGADVEEIAAELGITRGAARSTLHRARKQMREAVLA